MFMILQHLSLVMAHHGRGRYTHLCLLCDWCDGKASLRCHVLSVRVHYSESDWKSSWMKTVYWVDKLETLNLSFYLNLETVYMYLLLMDLILILL